MTHSTKEHFLYICIFYIQSSRKVHTPKDYEGHDDQERSIIFSSERHRELKSGVPANVLGRSSNR
jgi:hypothetical protein